MTDRVSCTPLGEHDLAYLAEYYRAEAGLAVALQFVANAEAATQTLAANPTIGATLGLTTGLEPNIRRWHIEGFPGLLVLYRPTEEGVTIIGVIADASDGDDLLPDVRS